jgi:hypothetical protein
MRTIRISRVFMFFGCSRRKLHVHSEQYFDQRQTPGVEGHAARRGNINVIEHDTPLLFHEERENFWPVGEHPVSLRE